MRFQRGFGFDVPNAVDLVYCCGPLTASRWRAVPSERRCGYAEIAATLERDGVAPIGGGDAVMVKGLPGSRLATLIKALARCHAPTVNED